MRNLVTLVAASALFVPLLAPPAFGQHKPPMPPAFGKQLVPDQQTKERNESKQAEIEEEQDGREHTAARPSHQGAHGGKVHIELDGDEDGGGDEGDDGGEF
jgi:hypothetical protein